MASERKIAQVLGVVTILCAILVLIGWWKDVVFLKGVLAGFVTMKLTTAVTFIASGALLVVLASPVERDVRQVFGFVCASAVLFLMSPFVFSVITGHPTGFEQLFVRDAQQVATGPMPGWPSPGTIVAFLLIAAFGLRESILEKPSRKTGKVLGGVIAAIGALALVGHAFGVSFLYYRFAEFNGMALNTSALFVLLGIGFFLVGKADDAQT